MFFFKTAYAFPVGVGSGGNTQLWKKMQERERKVCRLGRFQLGAVSGELTVPVIILISPLALLASQHGGIVTTSPEKLRKA